MGASERTGEEPTREDIRTTKQGPPNPQASDVETPSPPGSPLRSDEPAGNVFAAGTGSRTMPGEAEEVEQPMRSVAEPDSTTEPPTEVLMGEDNAQTSQREPSDDSGGE
jgi:hypothetical protein